MNNKFFKILGGSVVLVMIVLALIGKYAPQIQEYRYRWEAERFQKMVYEKKAKLDEARRNDTYGGKTPEETFDLFLDALNKGDILLASKYYDVTVQEKALEGLRKEVSEKGDLAQSLTYFSDVRKGVKKCADIDTEYGGCVFEYEYVTDKDITASVPNSPIFIKKGEKSTKSIELILDSFSDNWKITWPY